MGITSATVLTSRYKRYIELHYCTIHHDLLTSAQFYILQVITWSRCWRGGSLFLQWKKHGMSGCWFWSIIGDDCCGIKSLVYAEKILSCSDSFAVSMGNHMLWPYLLLSVSK